MKSPRDILIERHRHQVPALDRLRKRVLFPELEASQACVRRASAPTWFTAFRTWLTFPRAAWSGFAAVWCVILGLNLAAEREMAIHATSGAPVDSREFLAGWRMNRAQLAALLFDRDDDDASAIQKPKPTTGGDFDRPRKDAFRFITTYA